MKSLIRRTFSLLLISLLSLSLLTACGSEPVAESEGEPSAPQEDASFEPLHMEIFEDYELTLVNVFATWCSPCIREIPELQALSESYQDKKVQVIGVVIDALDRSSMQDTVGTLNQEALNQAALIAQKTGASYPFYVPNFELFEGRLLNVAAVPETFFVDQNGQVVGDTYPGARDEASWSAIVDSILEELPQEAA